MTAHAEAAPAEAVAPRPTGAGRVRQITTLVRRNLTHIKRQPEMLTDVTIQPIMFVLLFSQVYGGGGSADQGGQLGCGEGRAFHVSSRVSVSAQGSGLVSGRSQSHSRLWCLRRSRPQIAQRSAGSR